MFNLNQSLVRPLDRLNLEYEQPSEYPRFALLFDSIVPFRWPLSIEALHSRRTR